MDRIHTSERRSFRRCRKKWEYSYVRGLQPKETQPKLWLGTILHQALAVYYANLSTHNGPVLANNELEQAIFLEMARVDYNKLQEEQRDLINKDADLARAMLTHYCEEHEEDDITVPQVELYAEVPLNRATRVAVRLDGIAIDGDGDAWGLEHKTTSTIDQDAGYLELDEQATTYTWAMTRLSLGQGFIQRDGKLVPVRAGEFPILRGMLYNFLLKQVPHEPIYNKDGSISIASANMTCKAIDYEEVVIGRHGKDEEKWPEKYGTFLQKLRTKQWFHRVQVYRGPDELAGFEGRIWGEIKDMRFARNHTQEQCYRNPTRDCLWDCPYFQLCKGELEGLDMTFFQEENFETEKQLEMGV